MKAKRNRTIDLSVVEGKQYLERCLILNSKTSLDNIINKTIVGDVFNVTTFLPKQFVDLLIVDPPYNLSKNYHGKTFKKNER